MEHIVEWVYFDNYDKNEAPPPEAASNQLGDTRAKLRVMGWILSRDPR